MAEIDTTNDCLVGVCGVSLMILNPRRRMPKDRALVFAAYIVAMCDLSPDHKDFLAALLAVEST